MVLYSQYLGAGLQAVLLDSQTNARERSSEKSIELISQKRMTYCPTLQVQGKYTDKAQVSSHYKGQLQVHQC